MADAGADEGAEPVPEVCLAFHLNKAEGFGKADYKTHIKS